MPEIEYLERLYERKYSPVELVDALDGAVSSTGRQLRLLPFHCYDIERAFQAPRAGDHYALRMLRRTEDVQTFEISKTISLKGEKKTVAGHFFVSRSADFRNSFVAASLDGRDLFVKALRPLVRQSYPGVLTTFITHRKLRNLIDRFATEQGILSVTIKRASFRVRHPVNTEARPMPGVSWPNMVLDEAFRWVQENDGWFQSITFRALKGRIASTISMSRQGETKTDGLVPGVFKHFVGPVCRVLEENAELFRGRSRNETRGGYIRPLELGFGLPQFDTIEDNARFISAMRRMSNASISVIHGNPYIHLSVLDYEDASSFDVWVVSSDKIVIAPQLRGSVPAIKRIVNHIFDTFAEGRIKDYSEVAQ